MKIKAKITLGLGLLFLLIILMVVMGTRQVSKLADDTKEILADNYNTLEYSRKMLVALDGIKEKPTSNTVFKENLKKQKENVTEPGEKEITENLSDHFKTLESNFSDTLIYKNIRSDIYCLMNLNMQAIVRKSEKANDTAHMANYWILGTGALCFLIAISMLVNLPGYIANPLKELTQSIKQIADKNYTQRVRFESHDEFGELAAAFNVMAKKLEEYDNSNVSKLLKEKKRIETLINNMSDPVIGLDENKKILFANEEALKIASLKLEDVIGKSAQDVAVSNDLIRSLIKSLIHKEEKEETPLKIFADNKESYFEKETIDISIVPTGEKEKKLIGHVILLKNITPFKELDFAKTNFIATVSHEFKTPISSIKMSLKLLQDHRIGDVNPEQKQLMEIIQDEAERLLKITGELLNMAQVETGKIELNLQPSDPKKIVEYATEAIRFQADQKKIDLKISYSDPLPQVNADAEKTVWVLINLLSNAVRYSPEHSNIEVKVKVKEEGVVFSVKDFGKGIDEKYRARIFDRYFQVPGSQKSGTGLGLAISKEFIDAQGGKIWVDSEIGSGSAFEFSLQKAG